MELIDIFNLIIGVLCAYWAMVGKGYPYKLDYPPKIKRFAQKLIRICLAVISPFQLAMGIMAFTCRTDTGWKEPIWGTIYLICLGMSILALVAFVAVLYGKHGKEILAHNKKTKNQKPKYYK